MRIIVLNNHLPYVRGGAEFLAEGLVAALQRHGHRVDLLGLPCTYEFDRLTAEMLAARSYDFSGLADLVIALKFPAYLCRHPKKRLWLLHQDRASYDLWRSPLFPDLGTHPLAPSVRQAVFQADEIALPECEAIFTISKTVSRRLDSFSGLDSRVLYPPVPDAEQFHRLSPEPFLFFPSRLDPTKRQGLALEALALCRPEVRLVLAGFDAEMQGARALQLQSQRLGLDDRVTFLGYLSQAEKRDYYARCRAVLFPPFDEDYGYITVEAMLSSKPVITCCDSGGPVELVVHEQTGLICEPRPEALAQAMDRIWTDPGAEDLGRQGLLLSQKMIPDWDTVVASLTGEG